MYPRVIIVTKKIPLGDKQEKKARKAFFLLLKEKTTHNLSKQILDLYVVTLLLVYKVFSKAWYRHLKECLLNRSDKVQRRKEDTCTLFSVTYFAALFWYTYCNNLKLVHKQTVHIVSGKSVVLYKDSKLRREGR